VFIVPTVVRPSAIQGVGVFAAVSIPAGTNIWEYTPDVDWKISQEEMASFPQPFQTRLRRYTYLDESGWYVLCGDNAKFMNHDDSPNCDDHGMYTVALRDILMGEELTCDYRAFDTEFDGSEFRAASGIGSDLGQDLLAPDLARVNGSGSA
jgi:SET domain-containing protein